MSRFWYSLVLLFFLTITTYAEIRQLPFCNQPAKSRSLIFVSTLDGKLTALDASQEGKKKWSLDFQTEPLLSSNIHRRELNNNGQWVRLIPSLNGGLYKFDGENLEAVPVSVDQLLQASFRYSDDMIFSGGKETKTYGISSSSGRILYECKMSSCNNATGGGDSLREEDDVLIVRRHQHTVRAGDSRTGVERWNFSVGQHDLTILPHSNSCHQDSVLLDLEIKAIVPEGLVVAFSKANPTEKLWEYKFDSPVVSIWKEDQVNENRATPLKPVNIFDTSQMDVELDTSGPGIYLGMHERQLYIQENPAFQQAIEKLMKYPWKPHPAIEFSKDASDEREEDKPFEMGEALSTTALSVLYNSEYINGNGFYLYSREQMQLDAGNQCNGTKATDVLLNTDPKIEYVEQEGDEEETPVQVMIVSLWYWWKEVCIISITTAVLLNFMLTQKLLNATAQTTDAVLPPLIVERHVVDTREEIRKSQSEDAGDSSFLSRYESDYEPHDCLGRGGYGVVFKARNIIDDCDYAIKRITLPNRESARERVMREVKALAKLEHQNIVRYFNSWLECPPAGWLEEHDRQWKNHKNFNNSNFVTESSAADTSVRIDVPMSSSNASSVDSAREAYELDKTNDDSYIMFEAPSESDSTDDEEEEETNNPKTSTRSAHLSISVNSSSKDTDNDHSIVFEEPGGEISPHTIPSESSKQKISERKSQLDLDLRKRKDSGRSKSSTKMFLYIQMQLCQSCSLREWLRDTGEREISQVLNIFQQIVDAVEYIHLNNLIHRDLKPSNIFFAFDGRVKVGDFGLVTAMTEGLDGLHTPCNTDHPGKNESMHTAHVGTHLYMSPEQKNGKNYNYKVDIYSLGIILFELLTPFATDTERAKVLLNLRKSDFPKDFKVHHPSEYELLEKMLDENPEKRLTTIGIKALHPQLKNETLNNAKVNLNDSKWHFTLPPLSRHSSTTNSSGSDSRENVYAQN